jgi:hypothetical protein
VVFGEGTREHKDKLKRLGKGTAIWNPSLEAWTFPAAYSDSLMALVLDIETKRQQQEADKNKQSKQMLESKLQMLESELQLCKSGTERHRTHTAEVDIGVDGDVPCEDCKQCKKVDCKCGECRRECCDCKERREEVAQRKESGRKRPRRSDADDDDDDGGHRQTGNGAKRQRREADDGDERRTGNGAKGPVAAKTNRVPVLANSLNRSDDYYYDGDDGNIEPCDECRRMDAQCYCGTEDDD